MRARPAAVPSPERMPLCATAPGVPMRRPNLMMSPNHMPATSGSAPRREADAAADRVRALFLVTGDTDPGLLPRLVEPVAKLGLVPSRLHASTEDGDGSAVTVDLRLAGVARFEAERVASALRRVVGVHQVPAVIEKAG